jgi:hypothetical protein
MDNGGVETPVANDGMPVMDGLMLEMWIQIWRP